VAHQSGQTLAGLFLLRTLIEQWARSNAKIERDHAPDVLDAYVAGLPELFKQKFPTLRDSYSRLSADIHAAAGSDELFAASLADIDKLFDAQRLFELNG
jgi:hypothetical protein